MSWTLFSVSQGTAMTRGKDQGPLRVVKGPPLHKTGTLRVYTFSVRLSKHAASIHPKRIKSKDNSWI